MPLPLPDCQDLRQLVAHLDGLYVQLSALCERSASLLPEVQYRDHGAKLRIYTSLCANLNTQLGQYMRLRRLVILPYFEELKQKEEEGHDCRSCGGRCEMQHSRHVMDIQEAHASLHELAEHLHPFNLSLPASSLTGTELLRDFRATVIKVEELLTEILFIEESALVPLIKELQRKIWAHE
ncbi:MAG: hypothetical protein JST06_01845 [Bacteroidetes bacterium]|nr:hypothetical protein [Bacteroidota bacterium]MBS1630064.1 hypothetical protein [Bacteroidota bacterium]